MWSPYQPQQPFPYQPPQRGEIIKVNGRGGAEAFQLMPNSSILLLDANDPIVWLKTTDGAGYPTLIPYTITPYQPAPEITNADLLARIKKLEAIIHGKPDSTDARQPEPNGADWRDQPAPQRQPAGYGAADAPEQSSLR